MMPDVARVACDLCKQRSFEPVSSRDRRGNPLRTVVCRECGLVRHWHVPTEQQLRTFYAQQYRQAYHGEETPSPRRVMRAWENGKRIHLALQNYLDPSMKVLEVGAGIGCTVKYFRQQGLNARGIEPHRGFQQYAERQLRVDVSNRDLFDCHDVRNIDLVLLVHVIEHFRSPRAALQRIRSLLSPGGMLYMECPNLAAPFAVRHRLFHFAHIHNFTPLSLNALAATCGLELVSWIHSTEHPNLAGLWRWAARSPRVSYAGNYEAAKAALRRYNWLTYHLRLSYLTARTRKLVGYLHERWAAPKIVRQLTNCSDAHGTSTSSVAKGNAA